MRFGIATLFGRSTFVGAFETAVVIFTTVFVSVFFVIALTLPDVAVALTTPGPLEVVTISGLKAATT
jgi:hypothetical protein